MIAWMLPGAIAVSVLAALYALGHHAAVRRFVPELAIVAVIVLAVVFGLAPIDATRTTLWAYALWRLPMVGLLVMGIAWSGIRSETTGPVPATEALLAGWILGAIPAAALLAPRARDPRHAARIAVLATAASVVSPVGGPAQMLLGDRAFFVWAAPVALVLALLAWPWPERPTRPAWSLRALAPGVLGIPFGLAFGGMAGIGAFAAGVMIATPRPSRPAPPALAGALPLRAALAAALIAALLQLLGIPWGIAWTVDLGDRVPMIPWTLTAFTGLPALFVEPFATAALADRIMAQPSTPPDLVWLFALPLALSPAPALAVAAATHGWRTWWTGALLTLAALGLAVGWVALTR